MQADIHILHQSDVYRITDFKCHCNLCSLTAPEYNTSFCLSFIRNGFFEYHTFRRRDEVHVGRILLSKPGYEHLTGHIDHQPDITTVFEFKKDFFDTLKDDYPAGQWFLANNDIHALLLHCSAETDYLHHRIFQRVLHPPFSMLQVDEMVMQLLDKVMGILGNRQAPSSIAWGVKKNHLVTMAMAQQYIHRHFREEITLQQLATHCHVSPFHFSRLFKAVMNMPPHQYLLGVRLQHAGMLLTSSDKPISDIAFASGFNSLEHFATAYKKQSGLSPTQFRQQLV